MLGFNDFAIACTDLQRDLFAEQFPHGFLLEVSDTQLLSPFLALDAQYNIEFPEEETDCTKTYVIGEDASVDPSGLDLGDDDLVVYDEPSHRERADYALIPLALDGMREVARYIKRVLDFG